ncbi:MAG: sn-glycerol-3-phosphate ABC transporter ATP-binding protein UgpC [Planctomycetota bacterium]
MVSIELDGVWKTFPDGIEAVRGVDLTVGSGEFVVLVGPSGCGKSTTLRMIAGLEDISRGEVRIGGRAVNNVPAKDRDIAMVFQSYALYPHMTAFENMAFGLKLRKIPRAEIRDRVHKAADVLGLSDILDRKPRSLSGGQRQRVAVGRAIVREPAAFLFDEPLSNLDAKLRVATRSEFKALSERLETTTVYVTHDQEEAMTLGDRLVVMSEGAIQQIGSPFDVFASPVNRFVAGFIGTPPMNFFRGSVTRDAEQTTFRMEPPREAPDAGVPNVAPLTLDLPGRLAAGLPEGTLSDVVLGVRPSTARVLGENEPPRPASDLELLVEVVEPLGAQMDIHGRVATGEKAIFRVDATRTVPVRSVARLRLRADQAHLFEPGDFGACLTADPSAAVMIAPAEPPPAASPRAGSARPESAQLE